MRRKSGSGKNRMIRINDEILREVANIVRSEIKDPRVTSMTTVVKVETTNDLKHCKVFVSILGEKQEKAEVLEGLKNASGFIRKRLAEKINLRSTPEVKFILDESLEYSIKISKLISEVNSGE